MKRTTFGGLIACALTCIGLALGFGHTKVFLPALNAQAAESDAIPPKPDSQAGLVFRLSEGSQQPSKSRESTKVATGTPLSATEVDELFKKMPELTKPEKKEFAFRERSLPPPRAGKTIAVAFPPPETGPAKSGPLTIKPLAVARHAPEGDVSEAPALSVAFSQAMVPVTSQEELAKIPVPVSIKPALPGEWRWLGTRTAVFVPIGNRFLGSTKYTAEIPAGTTSAEKGKLADKFSWQFTTATLTMKSHLPGDDPQPLNPLIFIEFDQRIKQDALLQALTLKSAGRPYQYRLATAEEITKNKDIATKTKKLEANTYLVLAPAQELPAAQTFRVTIPAGIACGEGPLPTPRAQEFSFSTYGPLKILRDQSNVGDRTPLVPNNGWYVRFSNPLDPKTFKKEQVKIEPSLPFANVQCGGDYIYGIGQCTGRTTYKVTFSDQLTDVFGQRLQPPLSISVHVGPAQPQIGNLQQMVVLLPDARRSIPIQTINLNSVQAEISSVQPEDYGEFLKTRWNSPKNIGKQVFSGQIPIKSTPDAWVTTWVDLRPYLKHGLGNLVLTLHGKRWNNEYTEQCWIQSTQIGLSAIKDPTHVIGWASSLKDGSPLPGVTLQLNTWHASTASTGQDGMASLPLQMNDNTTPGILIARKGDDSAFVIQYQWSSWQAIEPKPQLKWYTLTDRSPYRPGEEVHLKGWMRELTPGTAGDITWSAGKSKKITYSVKDSRRAEIAHGEASVNKFGAFDFTFKLPDGVNTGQAFVELKAPDATGFISNAYTAYVTVEEFRRPEFEMSVKREDDAIPMIGKHVTLSANAKYYTGGPLANAHVDWQANANPTVYTPAGWGEYTFGGGAEFNPWFGIPSPDSMQSKTFQAATDAQGKHLLRVDFDSVTPPQPMSLAVQATVQDVNRQTWSDLTTVLVHPSELYVGIKPDAYFVDAKKPYKFNLIVTDLDGKPVADTDVKLQISKPETEADPNGGQPKVTETDLQEKSEQSTDKPQSLSFVPSTGGYYKLIASVKDSSGRKNQTTLHFWVQGYEQPSQHTLKEMKAELVLDKKEYKPGDTAKLMVRSPFSPARGLLVLERSGILSKQEFYVEKGSTSLTVPIKEAYLPNLHAQVHLVGLNETKQEGSTMETPAYADAQANIVVSTESRHLIVTAKPKDKELEPGAQTSVEINIADNAGKAVPAAEVAIGVVDESLLSLTGYRYPDPMAAFYTTHASDSEIFESRQSVLVERDKAEIALQSGAGYGGGGGGRIFASRAGGAMLKSSNSAVAEAAAAPAPLPPPGSMREESQMRLAADAAPPPPPEQPQQKPIQMRSNFAALAYFSPSVVSDADGHATISFKLPDNLTRYRIMAVAATDSKQFGNGDCSITARLPLMVRPSAPRFLNFGDKFELPVVLQNQSDKPLEVKVAVRSDNLDLTGVRGKKVEVPANDRIEVRFDASTAEAGTASYQVVAAADSCGDASEGKLPIWTPATTEAFATYGEIDDGAIAQPILSPSGVSKQFGGVQITTSSTALNALTDAFLYLKNYPFECSEQISSRLLAVVALKDMVAAFNPEGLGTAGQVNDSVKSDIDALAGRQGSDGGFGLWELGKDEYPYVTVHVMHALVVAKKKDFAVNDETYKRGLDYLRNIQRHIPSWYGKESRRSIVAYALHVRSLGGDFDTAAAHRLFLETKPEHTPFERLGWLLPILAHGGSATQQDADAIRTYLNNQANETSGTAQFGSSPDSMYGEDNYLLLHSSRRDDAVILDALIGDQPKNPLIPKVAAGLLAHRTKGRWDNTQECAFVLLALDRYFHTYEKVTPDFIARVWLGNASAGEQKFVGRSGDRKNIDVPMQYFADKPGEQNLVISKEGKGRLYYRIGMQYAPKDLVLKPMERGFHVERKYEAIENQADVKKNEDGTWQVKAGALVRVRLKMVAPGRRYHVALVDPLPAGFEPVNPDLQGSQHVEDKKDSPHRWWLCCFWWRPVWYDHQNLRDDRAEAFTSLLWDGTYEYTYSARATTPGTFITPPTKAEEMYAPETYGRAATDRVIVQ